VTLYSGVRSYSETNPKLNMKLTLLVLLLIVAPFANHAQTIGSVHIFPSNNPWNERIDSLPVHWNSAKYIANVGATVHIHPDFGSNALYGIPWVAVGGTQAFVPIDLSNGYTSESDPGPMPIPLTAPIEGGGNDGGDDHVLVVDTSNRHLYELYQGVRGTSGWAATSSAVFGLDSNNYRPDGWTSCDAAGLPIWPGLVKKYECDAGEIKHALRFTIQHTQKGWIFPARHHAGSTTDTTVMPMGLRLRLKAAFDDSKYTGNAKVITTALKRYGIILADNGSNWYISGETNTNWDDNDVGQLKNITGGDFEVVYTGPVRTTPNQYPDPVLPIPTGNTGGGISAPAFAYDTVSAGKSNTFAVVLQNTGSATINISTIKIKSGVNFSTTMSAPQTIAPNSSLSIPVKFTLSTPGQTVDTLTIKSDDPTNPSLKIPLVGTATSNASVSKAGAGTQLFEVYPNPTHGVLNVSAQVTGPISVQVTDALGRSVLSGNLGASNGSLDLSSLSNGSYFVRIVGVNGSEGKRIVVSR